MYKVYVRYFTNDGLAEYEENHKTKKQAEKAKTKYSKYKSVVSVRISGKRFKI